MSHPNLTNAITSLWAMFLLVYPSLLVLSKCLLPQEGTEM